MEIEQLDNESHAPIACEYCPNLRPHRSTHRIVTRQPDYSRRVDYLCAQAAARELGLMLWKHLPIDALDALDAEEHTRPRRHAVELSLGDRSAATLAPEPRPRMTPIEVLALNIRALVTGHADPSTAQLAELIGAALDTRAAGAVCE